MHSDVHRLQKGKEAPPAEAAPGPLDDVRRPDLPHLHEEGLAPAPAPVGPLQHDRRALLAQPPHDGPREVVPEAGLDRLRLCGNQPVRRVHIDGVEDDSTIQHERAVKF